MRIYLYDDYASDPAAMLRDAFAFLGANPDFTPDLAQRFHQSRVPRMPALVGLASRLVRAPTARRVLPQAVWTALRAVLFRSGKRPSPSPEDRRFLVDYYREDVRLLAQLIGRNLSHWLKDPGTAS